jgi:signal transduction histidine kinase/DNA-binding response OmpR family regulator/cellobiose-specific phosphotransferase system component IIB
MDYEMQNELIYYPSLQLIIKDAQNSSEKQVRDIKALLAEGIDLLIVSPNESYPLTNIVSEVYKKGIPVILIDRKINSEDYTAFLGGNNLEIGHEAGKYAVKLLKGNGRILEITGLEGSSPAVDRHKGFVDEISRYPGVKIVKSISGEWEVGIGRNAMKSVLSQHIGFDLVFAHNDVMAIGAYDEYIKSNKKKDAFFIGIDGSPGPDGGLQAVMDKKLDVTLLYPTGGGFAVSLAWKILNNQPYQKQNILNTLLIDSTNVRALKFQTDVIIGLNDRIVSAKKNLDSQIQKYYSQQFWLNVALGSLLLVILLVVMLLRAFRNKMKANLKLESQKKEITRQNEELKKISNELEEATKAKLIFFTNISHEFRTPLTLIIGPLEDMMASGNFPSDQKFQLEMMLRNAHRLLRLINQLMDLRKIDNEKMKLNAGEFDFIPFIKDIKEAFNELAVKKNIDFLFTTDVDKVLLFFDKDKVDKILFNLLSNAFKFTLSEGTIEINVKKVKHSFNSIEKEAVEIEIKDNGIGIPEKHLHQIFDRFYQVDQEKGSVFPGTGIGLPLSKGFIELHKGDINVVSKPGMGSSFFVYFQLGNEHLNNEDIITFDSEYDRIDKSIAMETDENLTSAEGVSKPPVDDVYSEKPLVMIVEDNADVAQFIKSCLSDNYRVMTAGNGLEGFEKMYIDEPDIIICDIMMPIMDGLQFTRKLKTDIRTCHIPLILLTARSSHDQKIEGLETGADSYIAKPFNKKHLLVRVNQLIANRQKIRKHYQADNLSQFVSDNKISQLDTTFLKKCSAAIDDHLTDSEYGVEQLAVEIGLSRVHVYRKIKHLTGLSVSEFIRNIKLKKAAVLLSESGKSVTEIAYETGFSSPAYFAKCFKDLYQMSPVEHIKNAKKK